MSAAEDVPTVQAEIFLFFLESEKSSVPGSVATDSPVMINSPIEHDRYIRVIFVLRNLKIFFIAPSAPLNMSVDPRYVYRLEDYGI